MTDRRITIWNGNKLFVEAELKATRDLVISGQDLSGAEYEYALSIAGADVDLVAAALGASRPTDVLELLAAHADEIVTMGESTWLKSHGIPAEFWSRTEMDFD